MKSVLIIAIIGISLVGCIHKGQSKDKQTEITPPANNMSELEYEEYLKKVLPVDVSREEMKNYLTDRQGWSYISTRYEDRTIDETTNSFVKLSEKGYDTFIVKRHDILVGQVWVVWSVRLYYDEANKLRNIRVSKSADGL